MLRHKIEYLERMVKVKREKLNAGVEGAIGNWYVVGISYCTNTHLILFTTATRRPSPRHIYEGFADAFGYFGALR